MILFDARVDAHGLKQDLPLLDLVSLELYWLTLIQCYLRSVLLYQVICSLCATEQNVQQHCIKCGVCMGKYFCSKCKFFDDDVSPFRRINTIAMNATFYLNCCALGIACRTGGEDNFFHCNKCGKIEASLLVVAIPNLLKDSHKCVERAMHHNCSVCFEFLFDTTRGITVLHCGHTIHLECVKEMERHFRYSCPICSKSYCDMSRVWEKLDREVASTPMPQMYDNKMVWILCNDCGEASEVNFNVLAHKCLKCNSYNTRQTRGGPASCSPGISQMMR
ncbi:hypothetical protein Pint_35735 [Pistacia integerrima]|uniref:Uncharacterized protein n=1 Tax=Pistacia integerrima TaxID=434235 RepID=A0ACC0Y1Y4_9ROSI|nr:hypothetical protein Pint_35735 [Pistacia integerrima]